MEGKLLKRFINIICLVHITLAPLTRARAEDQPDADMAHFVRATEDIEKISSSFFRQLRNPEKKAHFLTACKKFYTYYQNADCEIDAYVAYKDSILSNFNVAAKAIYTNLSEKKLKKPQFASAARNLDRLAMYFVVMVDSNPFPLLHQQMIEDERFNGTDRVFSLDAKAERPDSLLHFVASDRSLALLKVLRAEQQVADLVRFNPQQTITLQLRLLNSRPNDRARLDGLSSELRATLEGGSYLNAARDALGSAQELLRAFAEKDKLMAVNQEGDSVKYRAEFLRDIHNSLVELITKSPVEHVVKTLRARVREEGSGRMLAETGSRTVNRGISANMEAELSMTNIGVKGSLETREDHSTTRSASIASQLNDRDMRTDQLESEIENIDPGKLGGKTFKVTEKFSSL